MRSGGLLEMLSDILDTVEQLHTVSIEFTVLRENSLPIGLEIHLQCLLAEQKQKKTKKELEDIVAIALNDLQELKETVTTNC